MDQQRVEVYVRPVMSDSELAAVIAHEFGHVVDLTLLDDADLRALLRLLDPAPVR